MEKVFREEREFFPMKPVILELSIRIYRAFLSRNSKIFHEKKYNRRLYHPKFRFNFITEVYQN